MLKWSAHILVICLAILGMYNIVFVLFAMISYDPTGDQTLSSTYPGLHSRLSFGFLSVYSAMFLGAYVRSVQTLIAG